MKNDASTNNDTTFDITKISPSLTELAGLIQENSMDAYPCFQRLKETLHYPSVKQEM